MEQSYFVGPASDEVYEKNQAKSIDHSHRGYEPALVCIIPHVQIIFKVCACIVEVAPPEVE